MGLHATLLGCTELLESPQSCYEDRQCPVQMSCVEGACVLSSVSFPYQFEPLKDQGVDSGNLGMDMATDMGLDMTLPFERQSPVCTTSFGDELQLEPTVDEQGLPTATANQHKAFCLGDTLGVIGAQLYPVTEPDPPLDPNLLSLNLYDGDGGWSAACDDSEFRLRAEGLYSATVETTKYLGDDLSLLNAKYYVEESLSAALYFMIYPSCGAFSLPLRAPNDFEREDKRSVIFTPEDIFSLWFKSVVTSSNQIESDGQIIAVIGGDRTSCRFNDSTFINQDTLDVWGLQSGSAWLSWLSIAAERSTNSEQNNLFGELHVNIITSLDKSANEECSTLKKIRIGPWPLDGDTKQSWRNQVRLQVDPDQRELFFCNYNREQACNLSRWTEETGTQWLTDRQDEPILLSLQDDYVALADRIVVKKRVGDRLSYYELHTYRPCTDERLNTCFTEDPDEEKIVSFNLHDFQIMLFQEGDQRVPYLLWIEKTSEAWLLKRRRL